MADFTPTITEDIALNDSQHLYAGTVTGPNYATGGNLFDVSANRSFVYVKVDLPGYASSFDPTTQKVKLVRQKDPAAAGGADIAFPEVANAVDLTGVSGVWFGIGS